MTMSGRAKAIILPCIFIRVISPLTILYARLKKTEGIMGTHAPGGVQSIYPLNNLR